MTDSEFGPLRDYLARLPSDVANITLTIDMVKRLTGRNFRTRDFPPGELVEGWEVVEAIPKVGLALKRA